MTPKKVMNFSDPFISIPPRIGRVSFTFIKKCADAVFPFIFQSNAVVFQRNDFFCNDTDTINMKSTGIIKKFLSLKLYCWFNIANKVLLVRFQVHPMVRFSLL